MADRATTGPMTSRERVRAALAHRQPDRTPLFEYVLLSPIADHFLGHRYAYGDHFRELTAELGWERALRRQAQDIVTLAEVLGHDLLYVIPNHRPPSTPPAPVKQPTFDDPVDELTWRLDEGEASFRPPADEPHLIYQLVKEELARRELDLPIVAPAYAHGIWTNVVLMQVMVLAPEVAHRHFALATRAALARVDKYLELGIEMMGVGGDFAGNRGPLISPAAYRTFIMPAVRQVSRHIHAAGCHAVNASDGDLWPVIDDFLIGCEVDGYLEIESRAGMDLAKLKDRFGDRITFFGNVDCSNELSTGTPDEIRQLVLRCIEDGWGDGGHILCCNNAITESVPVVNYRAIIAAYRDCFGLPPLG